MKTKKITVRLTPRQARLLWGIVDGANDAGSCEGGLSEEEHEACHVFCDQVMGTW